MPSGFRRLAQRDLDNLKRKVDAGADRAITQFFFSPDCFFRFRDEVAAAGIDAEIVPGHPAGLQRRHRRAGSRRLCGAAIPDWLDDLFEGLDDLPAARQLIAATVAAELCGQLYAGGVRHFHFYTLNRAELSYAICHLLGVRAKAIMSAAASLPGRSRQAHPDQGRRLRHLDPGREGCRGRLLRRPRPAEGPERQQRSAEHHQARGRRGRSARASPRPARRSSRPTPSTPMRISQADYGAEALVREINRASARDHARGGGSLSAKDGRPRWVAGALGPTNKTLSLSPDVNDPGYPRSRFRPGESRLSRADRCAGRGRRRFHPDRDDVRHAQCQGRRSWRRSRPSRRSAASCR